MKPLTCSGPGELLHVDFTSMEETVPLKEEPVFQNVLVLQDHFSKYVVVYVVKDQTARTVRRNLAVHRSVTRFVIRQPIQRPRLLERVYKPMHTPH